MQSLLIIGHVLVCCAVDQTHLSDRSWAVVGTLVWNMPSPSLRLPLAVTSCF